MEIQHIKEKNSKVADALSMFHSDKPIAEDIRHHLDTKYQLYQGLPAYFNQDLTIYFQGPLLSHCSLSQWLIEESVQSTDLVPEVPTAPILRPSWDLLCFFFALHQILCFLEFLHVNSLSPKVIKKVLSSLKSMAKFHRLPAEMLCHHSVSL